MIENGPDAPAVERSYDEPYPIEYVGTGPRKYFGKLPVIQVDELPTEARRNALIFNRMIERAHKELDPDTVSGKIGWEALRLRCLVFQMTQKQYLAVSDLGNDSESTMKRAEEGKGNVTTYSTLLQEWPEIARQVDSNKSIHQEVERVRDAVSKLIVEDNPKSVNRLILRLMYKHGKDKTSLVYETVKSRMRMGLMGEHSTNYEAIKAFALCEPTEDSNPEQKDVDLWDHAYLKEFRRQTIADQMKFLQKRGQRCDTRAKLVEYLKLLCVPLISSISANNIKKNWPSISARDAAALMRNEITDSLVTEQILSTLVERKIIPEHVSSQVLDAWEAASSSETNNQKPVGLQLWEGLATQGMSDQMIAEIFDITGDSRTPLTREKIQDGSISDPKVPPFAVACLVHERKKDAHEWMVKLYSEISGRPYHAGKDFSLTHRTLSQYGISITDLPPEFQTIEVEKYASDRESKPSSEFFTEAHRVGQEHTLKYIRRWIAMYEPRTLQEAAEWMPIKERERTDFARSANFSPHRIHLIKEGKDLPPLPKMKTLIESGNGRWTPQLEIDWYLSHPDLQSYKTPLAKAAYTTIRRSGEFAHELYKKRYPNEEGAELSANLHRRAVLHVLRGDRSDTWLNRALDGFDIQPETETGVFYRCLKKASSMPDALNAWCAVMKQQKKMHLINNLLEVKRYIHFLETKTDDLEGLLEQKKWIREHMNTDEWISSAMQNNDLMQLVEVLRLLPGVSRNDLKEWTPNMASVDSTDELDFETIMKKEWEEGDLSSSEECIALGIDPRLPTQELPNSPRKELIMQARLEMQLPLHIEGDLKEDEIHLQRALESQKLQTIGSLADLEEDEDTEWELTMEKTVDSKLARGANLKKGDLAAAVNKLVNL